MNFTAWSRWGTRLVSTFVVLLWVSTADAQRFDEQFSHWPLDLTITGRIIVDNGIQDWGDLQPVLDRIAMNKTIACFRHEMVSPTNPLADALTTAVGEEGQVQIESFIELPLDELKAALSSASFVVIQSGDKQSVDLESLRKLEPELKQFLTKGGTLIVDSMTARLLGKIVLPNVLANGNGAGLNLMPDCVLMCDCGDVDYTKDDLLKVLIPQPRTVGIGLQRDMALMLSGRKVTCYGSRRTVFVLAGRDQVPPRIEMLLPSKADRQGSVESLLDLTEWRRDAIDRTLEPFPSADTETPFVEKGALVIVGGGGMPRGLMDRFVELAGGKEDARLVYIPCAEEIDVSGDRSTVREWAALGVKQATSLHTKDRQQANGDEDFLAPLKEATGIWFGGGRQWNLADSYYGTKAHRLMKEVLHRGGVIGGSSAGASIQARYLARATPIGNTSIMAPGYERGGLGFISGVAIDQHFSQRKRHQDMTQLMSRHPQLLGIGLDEATAIIVQKSKADVVGKGRVHFYDRQRPVQDDQPDYVALPTGSSYDLAQRAILVDTTKSLEEKEAEQKAEKSGEK